MRRLWISIKLLWRKIHAQPDTAHSIGRGLAVGFFMAMTPFFGLHVLLAFCLAWLISGNRVVAVIPVWLSNPLTVPAILWIEYNVGSIVLYGGRSAVGDAELEHFRSAMRLASREGFLHSITEAVRAVFSLDWSVLGPVLIGAVIMGLTVAVPIYFVSVFAIERLRRHRKTRRASFIMRRPPALDPEKNSASSQPPAATDADPDMPSQAR
ncbi:MAG: DUF2062 domain-containing protein [Planctomycetes bacterium]|nr:DUF2062 domain-containing protein [Planctomycetota bacterium]